MLSQQKNKAFQKIGSLMPNISHDAQSTGSMPMSSPTSFATTTSPEGTSSQIGTLPFGHGLTTRKSSETAIALTRAQPLTSAQLTQIHSRLLHEPLRIRLQERKTYGQRTISDDFGGYTVDGEPVGQEEAYEVSACFNPNVSPAMVTSALMLSPQSATLAHLVHLAVHKTLGSTIQDRSVLLSDYTRSLATHPEFVIFLTCKHFIENDTREFYPKLATMRAVASAIEEAIRDASERDATPKPVPMPAAPLTYRDIPREAWTEAEWQECIREAEAIAETAQGAPAMFSGFAEIAVERRREFAAWQQQRHEGELNGQR